MQHDKQVGKFSRNVTEQFLILKKQDATTPEISATATVLSFDTMNTR